MIREMWQDKVIAICQIGAIVALQFIIWSKEKPSLISSIMNIIFPAIISFALYTLDLYFATTTAALIALSWAVIALQKLAQIRSVK